MVSGKMTEHYKTEALIAKVRSLLQEGLTRDKIMESTGVTDRQLREYTRLIAEQDKELWKEEALESLENRALKIKRKYQALADVCDTIMNDDSKSPRDRIEAGKTGIACENNIYNMLKEGPLRFSNMTQEKKRLPPVDRTMDGNESTN